MDTQTQTGTGNEEFGLKVKALIKSREQLKEQNAQLEQRISDLQSLIKSKAIPPEPEPQAAQPVIPAVAPAAPYAAPQPILSPAPAQPFYQPQTQPQPAYTPQTQPQPAYTPPVFPAYRAPEPFYFRQSEAERIRADALAEAQHIVDDARRQADAIYAAAEMSLRSLCDELESAFHTAQEKLGEVISLYDTREKIISNMFSGRE